MARPPSGSGPAEHDQQLNLMRLLSERPALSQREISERMGLSLGKANYLVRALLDKGMLKAQNFRRSDNKVAYAYYLTPRGMTEKLKLTKAFLARKEREFESLSHEIQSLKLEVTDAPAKPSHRADADE